MTGCIPMQTPMAIMPTSIPALPATPLAATAMLPYFTRSWFENMPETQPSTTPMAIGIPRPITRRDTSFLSVKYLGETLKQSDFFTCR